MAKKSETTIASLFQGDVLQSLAKSSGTSANKVQNVLATALPVMLTGMQNNASTAAGEESLLTALSQHAEDDTSDIAKALSLADVTDGKKILAHLLGGENDDVLKSVAKNTGVSKAKVSDILAKVAPTLLSLIGLQNQSSSGGIGSLLGSLLGGGSSSSGSGQLAGSLVGMLLNNNNNSSSSSGDLLLGGSGSSSSSSGSLLGSLLGGSSSSSSSSSSSGSLLGSLLGGNDSSSSSSSSSSLGASLLGSLFGDDSQKSTTGKKASTGKKSTTAGKKASTSKKSTTSKKPSGGKGKKG